MRWVLDEKVLVTLDRAYQNVQDFTDFKSFLSCEKDYMEYVQEAPEFAAVINGLENEKGKLFNALEKLEEKALQELDEAEKFIFNFIDEDKEEKELNARTAGSSFLFGVTGLKMYKEDYINTATNYYVAENNKNRKRILPCRGACQNAPRLQYDDLPLYQGGES